VPRSGLESSEAVVPWQSHTGKNLGEFWGRSLSDYGFKGVVCALLGAAFVFCFLGPYS